MGTSAQERIALEITSTADLGAVHDARAAEENLRIETSKMTATVDQSREAWARAGGDMNKFAQELAKLVAGEKAAVPSTTSLGDAAANLTPKLRQVTDSTRAITLAQVEAIKMNEQMGTKVEAISPKARAAANSLASLANAAVTGGGSLSSIAVAAGGLTTNLLAVSRNAALAASASGIGALVTSLGVLIPLMTKANEEAEKWSRNFGSYSLKGLEVAAQRNRDQADEIQRHLQAFESMPAALRAQVNAGSILETGKGYGEGLLSKLKENAAERLRIEQALSEARREAAKSEQQDADARAKRDLDRAVSLEGALNRAYYEARDQRTLSDEDAAIAKARRSGNDQLLEIEQLAINEDRKKTLREAVTRATEEQVLAIKKSAADKQKEKDDKDAKEADERRRKQVAAAVNSFAAIVASSSSLKQVLMRAMLEPLEKYLLGKAVQHGIDALASLACLDFGGAARHAGVAAAAAAAAGKVAQLAGGSGGGGGGTGVAAGAGGGGTFSPRADAGDRNPTVINLITQNPFSRETMGIVQYELTRGGVLKQPVNVPPTTGLAVVH